MDLGLVAKSSRHALNPSLSRHKTKLRTSFRREDDAGSISGVALSCRNLRGDSGHTPLARMKIGKLVYYTGAVSVGTGEIVESTKGSRLRPAAPGLNAGRILDVGCGMNKYPGAIGIDRNAYTLADVIADIDHALPFADNSFREIRAIHVIEHIADVIHTMEEFHRLLTPGGQAVIVTPHYTDFSSFCDPTHRWHLNSFSFRYFGENHGGFGYYSSVKFRETSLRVRLLAVWKYLGFELLVNGSARFRRFWEHYLCYVIRGKVIEWRLTAVKAHDKVRETHLGE
jgi:SAM-dependent methyltransferase